MAIQIIRHAFRMVFGNFGQMLRISFGPLITIFLVVTVILIAAERLGIQNVVVSTIISTVCMIALLGVGVWAAVAWHRFILLGEHAGLFPAFVRDAILLYVGKSFMLAAILLFCFVPIGLLASVLGDQVGAFLQLGIPLAITYLWFRLGPVLPASAIDAPLGFRESWERTKTMSGAIWGITAILLCLFLGVQIAFWLVVSANPFLQLFQLICLALADFLIILIALSILTTLYGLIIEKRPLPQ